MRTISIVRTIAVTLKVQTDAVNTVEIATEVIVSDGDETNAARGTGALPRGLQLALPPGES